MKPILAAFAIFFSFSCMSAPDSPSEAPAKNGDSVIQGLLNALNTKDPVQLKKFVLDNFTDPDQADARVSKLNPIVSRGAPFTVVRELSSEPGKKKALIKDRESIQLDLEVMLTNPPESKISGILLGPHREEAPPVEVKSFTTLQSLADRLQVEAKAPALGICRMINGKSEVAVAGTRTVGGTKVGSDEPWSIGSVGKPLCSTIIGHLVEQGKLSWDSKLLDLIPELVKGTDYQNITIQQLLQHRSGVASETRITPDLVDRVGRGESNPTKLRTKYALDILKRKPLTSPGSKFSYSNAGYVLLGVVAEKLTGKSYESLVKDWIFAPLGLKHSYTYADKLPLARPMGHGQMPDGVQPMDMAGLIEAMLAPAGGGMYMSLGDLAKFGDAHLQGLNGKDGLLKARTVQHLHMGNEQPAGPNVNYACGWGLEKHDGLETMHGHNGSNGTMYAQIGIFPKARMVVVSMMNMGSMPKNAAPSNAVLVVAKQNAKN
jgi:CubicO group peptidase (beta-lactamase class C family)